jgi:hypothetical protein
LNRFHRANNEGSARLISEIQHLLAHLGDQQLQLYLVTELLSNFYHQIQDPEPVISQGLEYCKHINDPKTKSMFNGQLSSIMTRMNSQAPSTWSQCTIILKLRMISQRPPICATELYQYYRQVLGQYIHFPKQNLGCGIDQTSHFPAAT